MKNSHLVIIAIALIVSAFVLGAYLYQSQEGKTQSAKLSDNLAALTKPHSPRAGNPDAKVTIVEFMDPACGTCAIFHPYVKQLMEQNKGKVNLVIRYAAFHPGSDVMVKILEAMKKENQYWQVLDLMFESQQGWAINHKAHPEIFMGYMEKMGYDVAKLKQEITAPGYDSIVVQDLADAESLGANRTPTFFVNGKPLPSFGFEQLRDLVAAEVAANY